jgi:prephenate dehydrogenase
MEKSKFKIAVIGVGLIGGSMALDLKKNNFCGEIIGVDNNTDHLKEALERGIIDSSLPLDSMALQADIVIIATPVNTSKDLLIKLLDQIRKDAVIIDVGSLKAPICLAVEKHKNRAQFVACHPIAGTEFSGPSAAHHNLFKDKVNIICEEEKSSKSALRIIYSMFEAIGSTNILMDATTHDQHITYVSHLSHITSFALSLTVQELEKADQNIYNMAGSGFTSTVRLAKSSAKMWVPILIENKQIMSKAIDDYINKLQLLKKHIDSSNETQLAKNIERANGVSKVI